MKHIRNPASHSNGKRRSCNKMQRRQEVKPLDGAMLGKMRLRDALERALVKPGANPKVGRIVVQTLAKHQHAGFYTARELFGWNAHLSFKTYSELKVRCGL